MSLVFAAVTPHPSLLIPSVGKEKGLAKLEQTKQALEQLEQDLYLAKSNIILVISPHEGLFEDAFVVNAHTQFTASFEQFGDLVTKQQWTGSTDLAAKIAHVGNTSSLPVRLVSEEKLTHGASVPLHYLGGHIPQVKVLPVGFSNLEPKQHIAFGELLKEVIMNTDKRVAVIASGDLSHTLTEDAPMGYNQLGAKFDQILIDHLQTRNTAGIVQMDPMIVESAHECGYRSILILLGLLKEMEYSFKNYSYEHPFGVGYLVGNFAF